MGRRCESVSLSVVSNSLQPHGLQPARLLCPWNSPGKNTGVGCQSLLQGIFLTQGLNPGLLHCRQTSPSTIRATRKDCLCSYNGILYSGENNYGYLYQHGWMWKNITLNKIKAEIIIYNLFSLYKCHKQVKQYYWWK